MCSRMKDEEYGKRIYDRTTIRLIIAELKRKKRGFQHENK